MKIRFICILLLITTTTFSQNLIHNGGFELIKKCPDDYAQIYLAEGWYNIFNGCMYQASVYNLCSDPSDFNMAIPGLRKPRTGNGYAGIVAGEYQTIQTKLIKKLEKDKQYHVEFYLKSENGTECALTPIYGLLTKHSDIDSIVKYEDITNQVCIKDYRRLLDPAKWIKVEGVYTANGDEKFFTISYINMSNKEFCLCLYSIDDISVYPLNENYTIAQTRQKLDTIKYKAGDVLMLANINFEYNKSLLLPNAYPFLDKLFIYLQNNTEIAITISGHTDNKGSVKRNYKLSKERAKAVFNYLHQKGINKSKMNYKTYGSTKPLNDNTNEKNRQQNRRVEIELVAKTKIKE